MAVPLTVPRKGLRFVIPRNYIAALPGSTKFPLTAPSQRFILSPHRHSPKTSVLKVNRVPKTASRQGFLSSLFVA